MISLSIAVVLLDIHDSNQRGKAIKENIVLNWSCSKTKTALRKQAQCKAGSTYKNQ